MRRVSMEKQFVVTVTNPRSFHVMAFIVTAKSSKAALRKVSQSFWDGLTKAERSGESRSRFFRVVEKLMEAFTPQVL
jgi:hypothetical protein